MNGLRKLLILMLFVPASVVASSHLLAASKHATKEEAQAMATWHGLVGEAPAIANTD